MENKRSKRRNTRLYCIRRAGSKKGARFWRVDVRGAWRGLLLSGGVIIAAKVPCPTLVIFFFENVTRPLLLDARFQFKFL